MTTPETVNPITSPIDALEERIRDNCKAVDVEAAYCDSLDESYSFEKVGGPFAHMLPSRVLKDHDPIAYRCGLVDYQDVLEVVEIGSDYYQQDDCEKQRDELVDELDSQLADAQDEDDDSLEGSEDVQAIKSAIATLKKHSF